LGSLKVKICGVASANTVYVLDGIADYLGFISSKVGASPRSVELTIIGVLAGAVNRSRAVAVLHGYTVEEAVRGVASLAVDVLQLHSPMRIEEVAAAATALEPMGVRIAPLVEWTGSHWDPMDPCEYYRALEGNVGRGNLEYLIVDARKGDNVRVQGIPRTEIKRLTACIDRLAVAGGITPRNVCSVASLGPSIVDVSRGVERGIPGVKALDLAVELVSNARRCAGR